MEKQFNKMKKIESNNNKSQFAWTSTMRSYIILATMSIILIGSVASNANAVSGSFKQYFKIHINKGDSVIGKYGVIIRNTATDVDDTKFFVDATSSSQYVYTSGSITAHSGDKLQACFMKMSNEEMDCDYKTASKGDVIDFYLDIADAY